MEEERGMAVKRSTKESCGDGTAERFDCCGAG